MTRQSLILTLFIATMTEIVSGQGFVRGRVYDNETQEPLAGVYVVYGADKGTTTDRQGRYFFSSSSPDVTVRFQFIGYSPLVKEAHIIIGDTLVIDAGLVTDIKEIGQIVVTASRSEQKISALTVSMDLIKSADFLKNHITDSRELLGKTPGIEVLDGQASIRGGSGFSYGVGSRVLALIDGLPILSPDAGNIKWQFLPMENISQVEILKGASSVLYGSSALNGIINFRTAGATTSGETNFYAGTGVYGRPRNRSWIWWNKPVIFSDYSFSHLRRYGKNDIGIGINIADNKSYRKYNDELLGRLSFRLKHHNEKVEGLEYGVSINSGYTDKTDFVLWENAETGALKQDTSTVSHIRGSFIAVDPFISFNNKGRFTHDLKMRLQATGNNFPVRKENNSDAMSLYAEYQLNYKISESINIASGLVENYTKVLSDFYGDHKVINLAFFSQAEASLFQKLKVAAGIRVEHNALDGINDRTIPIFRTGINYQAARFTFLRASVGQGYRYPSIAEKFASTTLGSVRIIPNPEIRPESGWSSEAGVKQGLAFGKIRGQADLSAFFSQNSDLIEFQLTNFPYTGFRATNVEQSRIYGFELECVLERSAGELNISMNGGYTYTYPVGFNEYTGKSNDTWLKYRRKHSLKMNWNAGYRKFEAGISVYARSKILNIDNVFLDEMTRESILPGFYDYWREHNTGYFLADCNLGYNINSHFMVSAAVKNLTNTEYMGRPGDIQPQRNYSLRIAGKF